MKYAMYVISISCIFSLVACGNGGSITFKNGDTEETPPPNAINSPAGFNMVSGSQAIMIQSGQTAATGYQAKVQMNELQGIELTGGGYTARLKFTTRNQ